VVEGSEDTINKQLNEFKLEIRIEFFSIPNTDNRDFGTADSLRHLYSKDKIKVLLKKTLNLIKFSFVKKIFV
jgi:hypothetical protein